MKAAESQCDGLQVDSASPVDPRTVKEVLAVAGRTVSGFLSVLVVVRGWRGAWLGPDCGACGLCEPTNHCSLTGVRQGSGLFSRRPAGM